jgi:thioredoxin reductase (NADPH)
MGNDVRKGRPHVRYDCIVVGGGIAGLQAAIQLGRYHHRVLVIDSNNGRSSLCRSYQNLLGWPNGISGQELRDIGRRQAETLGVTFVADTVDEGIRDDDCFRLSCRSGSHYECNRLLISTGISDNIPMLPQVRECLGVTVYVCPDCDGYEITNRRTLVLGAGNVGANMALTLTYWSRDLVYINHEQTLVDASLLDQLRQQSIEYIAEPIVEVITDGVNIRGVVLQSGSRVTGERGFIAFGGNVVHSALAKQLGVELLENKHILVDPRTKMTNVPFVWAAGDVVAHSEQVSIAMGEGSQAAIWIHKSLMSE